MSLTYEIRASGLHGMGMFALLDLKPGDLISSEPVAMEVSNAIGEEAADPRELYRVFNTLPKEVQEQLMRLTPTADPTYLHRIHEILGPYETEALTVASIFSNNCFGDDRTAWLSLTISRINHSCIPNACVHQEDGGQSIRAISPIAKDQEILITYVRLAASAAERQDRLKRLWGFECDCAACRPQTEEERAIDERRVRLKDVMVQLEGDETVEGYEEALQLIENATELVGYRAHLAPRVAFLYYAKHNQAEKALHWYEEAAAANAVYRGAEYERTVFYREMVEVCRKKGLSEVKGEGVSSGGEMADSLLM